MLEATPWTDVWAEDDDGDAAVLVDDQVLVLSSLAWVTASAVRDGVAVSDEDLAELLTSTFGTPAGHDSLSETRTVVGSLVAAGVLRYRA